MTLPLYEYSQEKSPRSAFNWGLGGSQKRSGSF